MWDKTVMELFNVVLGGYFVSCLLCNVEGGFNWVISGVYGPNDDRLM
jgi:hypothetical protein